MNKLLQQTSRIALVVAVLTAAAQAQFGDLSVLSGGSLALAAPVSGIRVDGDLSDWPDGMQRLPLLNEFGAYGVTDLHNKDLTTSDDFHATLMVAYDRDEGMLYVGVEVWDDHLYMDGNSIYRDGIELYVSDLSSGSSPVQYRIATSRTNPMPGNGGMWRNEGDQLVYEWRGAVLDDDRQPVALTEGTVVGFDVVAIDNDGHGNAAWIPWGPPVGSKYSDNDRVGRLLLAPAALTLAEIDKLSTVLGAFHRGHGHGLQALEDHEADLEDMIERLAEHNGEAAGRHAAVFAAQLASQIATAASASAVASAEASLARLDMPAPANRPVARPLPIRSNGDDGIGEDSMTGQIINILGACALILAIGFTVSLIRRGGTGGKDAGPAAAALEERIAQIESRMTDTQDVMIALSEKLDRIDESGSKGKAS